jgi:excisionase family DNA binding protein
MTPLRSAEEGMSLRDCAAHLGVHYNTVGKWVKDGLLPVTRFGPYGRIVRVHPDDLHRMVVGPDRTGE